MGIDVYMRWRGMTEKEKDAQVTGFSTEHGHVGYLREAYHGNPYATKVLVPEAFDASKENGIAIAAEELRKRLPEAKKAAITRLREIYKEPFADENHKEVKSFADFVELAEKKEKETGTPVKIIVSW